MYSGAFSTYKGYMRCRRLRLIENYNELCLWFQYAIECSLFFQVWQKLLLNENTVTVSTKWLCIQELGTDLVFLRLWPPVKSFRMEKPGNFIAVYVYQNGEKFQNSILSQEGNLRQRTYLNILLLIFSWYITASGLIYYLFQCIHTYTVS